MPYKAWTVTIGGEEHVVEIEWAFWGSFKMKLDGAIVKKRFLSPSRVDFKMASTPAVLSRSGVFSFLTKWELYVGGKLVRE